MRSPSGKLRLPTVRMNTTQAEGVALAQILRGLLGLAESKKLNAANNGQQNQATKRLWNIL